MSIRVLRIDGTVAEIDNGDLPKGLPTDLSDRPAVSFECFGNYFFRQICNAGNWRLSSNSLIDSRGEKRVAGSPDQVLEVVSSTGNWVEWDQLQMFKKIRDLEYQLANKEGGMRRAEEDLKEKKQEINNLLDILSKIYIINEGGGSGSRKAVRKLIEPLLSFCEECTRPTSCCICE